MSALPHWAAGLPEVVCAEIARARDADRSARRVEARDAYERIIHRLPPWPLYGAAATGLMRWIARTYVDDANLEAAADCLEAALASARAQEDEAGVAHAINMLAAVAHTAGELDEAERLYEEARTHAFVAGEHELAAMVQQNLGVIANIRGDLRDALTHYHASLDAYRALGLDARAGLLANNLGMVYTDLREWPAAERAFEEARASCRSRGDVAALLRVETNLAELWVARGDVERARALCAEVLEASREHAGGPWLGDTHRHYGAACREAGALHEAETHLARAAAIAGERRDPLLAAETSRELAELFARQGRHRETLKHLNQAHNVFERLRARRDLADVARRLGRLEERYLELVGAWSSSIEQADPYTKGHCERVADLACALAACVGFGDQPLFWVRVGALLHDVGKTVVPLEILNKSGKLTPEERAIMERHAPAGAALLADVEFPDDVLAMVRSHHERWDGSGYP
ncbi:MAG TPA: tetratricopeptide repeat protein, partial [Gemmatimonadaceae bacterium]|nr:tetratricopeptide repeat protein [Gemmatimonadaceae bacterium]